MKTKTKQSDPVSIGLGKEARGRSVEILAGILGDQHVLYMKTRNFHWNLTGPHFNALHAFFEEQYNALAAAIDETAERIRMLGSASPGSMKELLALASLKESPGALIDGEAAVAALLDDHEAVIRSLREAIDALAEAGDTGSEDFATGLLQAHEKAAWMLRSVVH